MFLTFDYDGADPAMDPDTPIPFKVTDAARNYLENHPAMCVRNMCKRTPDPDCPVGYCYSHCADEAIQFGHRHS